MDAKNIKIKMNSQRTNAFLVQILKKRRLIFIMVFGVSLLYSFNLIYKKAYVDINFIDYPVEIENLTIGKEDVALTKIIEALDRREKNMENLQTKTYRNPFVFRKSQEKETAEIEESDSGFEEGYRIQE